LFLLHGDGKYMDIFERTLYNGFLAGISIEGNTFFYPNPLEFDGEYKFNQGKACRSPWFDCSCCPVNIVRFLPSLPGYIYATKEDEVFVNLFMPGKSKIELSDQTIEVIQETDYPNDGKVSFTLYPESPIEFNLKIRIPSWSLGEPVPGNLYTYINNQENDIEILVNNSKAVFEIENGYAVLSRNWKKNDVIELDLQMPIRKVLANEQVEEDRQRLAIERGPLVYCAEGIDNQGSVLNLLIEKDSKLAHDFKPNLLNGITMLSGKAKIFNNNQKNIKNWKEIIYKSVPYYTWAHRGISEMAVWFPYDKSAFHFNFIEHSAINLPVKLTYDESPRYGKRVKLTDGKKAKPERLSEWVGFEGKNFDAYINLNTEKTFSIVTVRFLQEIEKWIFLPKEVELSIAENINKYNKIATIKNPINEKKKGQIVYDFKFNINSKKIKSLHIKANNIGTCPDWHKGAGGKSWLFIDEIIVE